MKTTAKRNEYKSRGAFEADLDLMVNNAIYFNGPTDYVAITA